MEEGKNAFRTLTDIPTGKRPPGRPRRRRKICILELILKRNGYQYEELDLFKLG